MCPRRAAQCSGVLPSLYREFTSAPTFSNHFATSRRPICEATCNGVEPSAERECMSAPCANNNLATSICPSSIDACNGVPQLPSI
ncbi:hypothetical protein EDB83DRAFT_2442531 [Lactarius deliciosus]|nr:hypothetical protein EDB83DRAFT_2442531 [Lactarius deliciosus]